LGQRPITEAGGLAADTGNISKPMTDRVTILKENLGVSTTAKKNFLRVIRQLLQLTTGNSSIGDLAVDMVVSDCL